VAVGVHVTCGGRWSPRPMLAMVEGRTIHGSEWYSWWGGDKVQVVKV
jgi:hypothetical protein